MTQQTPPPVSGLAGVLSIVQAVVNLVPRWLVVAAGLVFVAWLGFDLYLNARQKLAQTEQVEAQSAIAKAQADAKTLPVHADLRIGTNPIGGTPPVE